MKSIRSTFLLALAVLLAAAGSAPLPADEVTIGADGELSLNRPFCGS